MRIRDPGWRQFGSEMQKSRIRDKHPGSATLPKTYGSYGSEFGKINLNFPEKKAGLGSNKNNKITLQTDVMTLS
jgi:hypothetical protein